MRRALHVVSTYLERSEVNNCFSATTPFVKSSRLPATYVGYLLQINLDNCGSSKAIRSRLHCLLKEERKSTHITTERAPLKVLQLIRVANFEVPDLGGSLPHYHGHG